MNLRVNAFAIAIGISLFPAFNSAIADDFLTMCGGGIGALPSPWTRNGDVLSYLEGDVGINTSTPQSTLDVNGTIRANDIILNTPSGDQHLNAVGSPTNPMVINLVNADSVTWSCQEVNLQELCGDADGCRIVAQLQHETEGLDMVRSYAFSLYMEQSDLPDNYPGKYGYSTPLDMSWISGDATAHIVATLFSFEGAAWSYIVDYKHAACPGNGPSNAVLPAYNFTFMAYPTVRGKFLIYDQP